jgi:probable rRNA maturation factor
MKSDGLPEISILNRQRKVALDRAELEAFARRALPFCARASGGGCLTTLSEIDVVLVSDPKISELHRRFMHISGPTDVITFQHGEIFISVETAWRQAEAFGTSLTYELRLYVVHGLLHLRGFDDHEQAARQRMHSIQKKIVGLASR